jgi:hypothetical protein
MNDFVNQNVPNALLFQGFYSPVRAINHSMDAM